MIKKMLALLILFSVMMLPIASVSAMTAKTSQTTASAVRLTLPANVIIKNLTTTNLSLNIAEFSVVSNSKRTNLGNINFTKLDSGGVSIRLRTESGKDLEMRVNLGANGKYSLKMESGQKTANTEFSDISQLANSLPVNEFSKNLAKDSEISKLILESGKSLGSSSTAFNTKCFDDSCAWAVSMCILNLIGWGISLAGVFSCLETAGIGCVVAAIGYLIGSVTAGATCAGMDAACEGKTEEERGVSVRNGQIFITFEPIITDVDCSDPLVNCIEPMQPASPIIND